MEHGSPLIAGVGLTDHARRSHWPARLDLAQSASGLVLALFMWVHMFFVSSILLGNDAMWTVTKFFEGYFFFGRSYPWIVSIVVASIIALVVTHAVLAMRKFPINYRQFGTFRSHMRMMHHEDTTLWFWQVFTGFALFFLASVHLYIMLTRPDRIGPFESADRVWTEHFWPLYILLLLAVELHGGIGLYRLAVKWGWFARRERDAAPAQGRQMVADRLLPGLGLGDAGGVYQDRHRAPGPLRRALRAFPIAGALAAHRAARR